MTNKDLFATIKDINAINEEMNALLLECNGDIFSLSEKQLNEYEELNKSIEGLLDCITVNCPRWKHYHAYTLKGGYKRKDGTFSKYWIEFAS